MDDKIHDAFDSVTTPEHLKASTKIFLQEQRTQEHKKSISPVIRRFALAACAIFVILIGFGSYHSLFQTPVSYISIDVNPSIELTLNRFDRVISAEAYNDDGTLILDTVSVNGMSYTDAVNAIVESDAMKPYLTDTSALTFTVASNNNKIEEKIRAGIESCSGYQNFKGQCYISSDATIEEAHENGMSFGKYSAYLILAQYDATITPEDCANMSMSEIRELIRQCEESVSNSGQGHENSQNGNGGNNGNGNHKKHNANEDT